MIFCLTEASDGLFSLFFCQSEASNVQIFSFSAQPRARMICFCCFLLVGVPAGARSSTYLNSCGSTYLAAIVPPLKLMVMLVFEKSRATALFVGPVEGILFDDQ